jgi:hypothetical protein
MADFALWATACEPASWPAGTFVRGYGANRRSAIQGIIDADPVAACVRALMAGRSSCAAELLRLDLGRSRNRISRNPPTGPRTPARWPAGCVGRSRSCGRWASTSPSLVKAAPAAGSSAFALRWKVPSVPSAASVGTGANWDQTSLRRLSCSVRTTVKLNWWAGAVGQTADDADGADANAGFHFG